MRIAILSEYFYPDNSGGTPTDLSDLAAALKARYSELTIDVITSRNLYRTAEPLGGLPRFEVWASLNIKRLRVPKSNRPSMLLRLFWGGFFAVAVLIELFRRRRYDLIFVVTNPPALAGAVWLYNIVMHVPYLYLVHDLYPDIPVALGKVKATGRLTKMFRYLQRGWLQRANCVVVLGRCMREHLLQNYKIPGSLIRVIPSWGAAAISTGVEHGSAFRQQLNFPGTVALYAGNFSEYVRLDHFLSAANLLKNRADILIVLVGDGAHRVVIQREIVRLGLPNVRLLPRVPREMMGEVLGGCDIALISLDQRMLGLGVPSKLYTILAAGRAVLAVVPDQSEVALVVAEEVCGANISSGSAEEIAATLTRLADGRSDCERYGENARRALLTKYTIDNACVAYREAFTRCVNNEPSRI